MNTATENINITELEKRVIEAISMGDDYDDMPTNCIKNIAAITGLSTKIIRGVLSSLLQKEILTQGSYPNGMTAFHLVQA